MRLIDRSLTLTSCRVIYSNSQTSTSFSADGFIVFLLKIKLNRISSYFHLNISGQGQTRTGVDLKSADLQSAAIATMRPTHKWPLRDLNSTFAAWEAAVLTFRLRDHNAHIRIRTWINRFYAPLRSVQGNRPPDDLNRSRSFYPLNYTSICGLNIFQLSPVYSLFMR